MELKTPLYGAHVKAGGKIVPFAGYLLPVQYGTGVITEHMAVREKAGLFDVSHMGEVLCQGKDALANLQKLLTNDFTNMVDGQARYSPMCNENGGTVDDLIVYKRGDNDYFIVVNAANKDKDYQWMLDHQFGEVTFAVMGTVRPGDMGFDVIHLNLHKTFSTPHGGGGPGSGPVGCKSMLLQFLPSYRVVEKEGALAMEKAEHSIGEMKEFYGNFLVVVKALTYLMTLGKEGIPEASQNAVLNANYMMNKLKDLYTMAYDEVCMHEFVMSLEDLKKKAGVSAMDIAKGLLDNGIHPPTMYFPLIVHEALMVEPTETESKEVLDHAIEVFRKLYNDALENPESLLQAPVTTPVTRMDEVEAARHPVLKYEFES